MILLTSTSDKIQVVTVSSSSIEVHASWADNASGTITPGRTNTAAITGTGTTDIVASPGASTQRKIKFLSVRNDHASISNLTDIQHTDGTNVETLWRGTLLAGETIVYNENVGWQYLDANGNPKLAAAKLDAWLRVTGDVTNATTSMADITGLTAAVLNGKKYMFEAHLYHSTNATTTGAQFSVNGPAVTSVIFQNISVVTASVTAAALSAGGSTSLGTAATAQTTGSGATVVMTILSGTIIPSADGTFAVRCASEVAVAGGLVVKAGSWLHIRELDN